jgi:hypothetical protein
LLIKLLKLELSKTFEYVKLPLRKSFISITNRLQKLLFISRLNILPFISLIWRILLHLFSIFVKHGKIRKLTLFYLIFQLFTCENCMLHSFALFSSSYNNSISIMAKSTRLLTLLATNCIKEMHRVNGKSNHILNSL